MQPSPSTSSPDPIAGAALVTLLTITVVMLLALVTQTPPHPPLAIPLFALAPFLGASLALGAAALYLCRSGTRMWRIAAMAFIVSVLPSFGPHKLLVAEFTQIWPAVLVAEAALVVLVLRLAAGFRKDRPATDHRQGKASA
ncbi:hypothetical protein [Nisaea sediminum]|uniref:hypothetical protein n=1 Tax=Nisaea sediminum TaxID=2775867 RepID=UPI001867364C|nr:hypothetical protein [Nisaea sediminum]